MGPRLDGTGDGQMQKCMAELHGESRCCDLATPFAGAGLAAAPAAENYHRFSNGNPDL